MNYNDLKTPTTKHLRLTTLKPTGTRYSLQGDVAGEYGEGEDKGELTSEFRLSEATWQFLHWRDN